MQSKSSCVVVLGTGGTIAGTAPEGASDAAYTAAQLGVVDLLAGVAGLSEAAQGARLEAEQVAQIDSKDMDFAVWQALVARVQFHLAREEVLGIIVTHGTDTLEETAYFLHRVLVPAKPVVLTAAMRPATSVEADGPRHLRQSVQVVVEGGWAGVAVVLQGEVHDACTVRKVHPRALRAFESVPPGPVAVLNEANGRWQWHRQVTASTGPVSAACLRMAPSTWPWVEVVHSHAGARAEAVRAWCAAGVQGLIVVATGNGTVHHQLELALHEAQATGVRVWRCTRCPQAHLSSSSEDGLGHKADDEAGRGCGRPTALAVPAARIALMLDLMGA